jgi:hypothetical protein
MSTILAPASAARASTSLGVEGVASGFFAIISERHP